MGSIFKTAGNNSWFNSAGDKTPSVNIFSQNASPNVKESVLSGHMHRGESDSSEGGEGEEGSNSEVAKSEEGGKGELRYDYKSDCRVLWTGDINRFKKDQGDLVERVTGSVIFDEKSRLYSVVIRLRATKNIIFNGLLLPAKSTIRPMLSKRESPQLLVFCLRENKLESHYIKLQISA